MTTTKTAQTITFTEFCPHCKCEQNCQFKNGDTKLLICTYCDYNWPDPRGETHVQVRISIPLRHMHVNGMAQLIKVAGVLNVKVTEPVSTDDKMAFFEFDAEEIITAATLQELLHQKGIRLAQET